MLDGITQALPPPQKQANYRRSFTKAVSPKKIKSKNKIGALHYLAAWQGLRGEDLHLDTDAEISVTCSKTGVPVTFTLDITKLFKAAEGGTDD